MGAGCSSPLRRLAGKRGKQSRQESSPVFDRDDQPQPDTSSPERKTHERHHQKFILENETTIQSEINEDNPSTASYYTDGKNHNEENKAREQTGNLEPKTLGLDRASSTSGSATAKMAALNGSYISHDRHLLVSPALSPAPSTCYSPSPANSNLGVPTQLDLNELREAFKTITFGLPNQPNQRIKQPERQQSEMQNLYSQQLVQNQEDLSDYISVIFISNDLPDSKTSSSTEKRGGTSNKRLSYVENLASSIESNLRLLCDDHLFNLRFYNLSLAHLSETFHINNILDVSLRILEQEYSENAQRIMIVVLSNATDDGSQKEATIVSDDSQLNRYLYKRQLPTQIEAQLMNKLLDSSNLDSCTKELFKRWYNQVGNIFYLSPIYLIYPDICSSAKDDRDQAWQSWLDESMSLKKAIHFIQGEDLELGSSVKLQSIFTSVIDYIMREPALQRRTLLIRNQTQHAGNTLNGPQQHDLVQQSTPTQIKDENFTDFLKLLSDPNKLTLKRSMSEEECTKTISDWVAESFNKFLDSVLETRITSGKQIPPFIERNLFTELTCQRLHLESYLDNITESFETKCHSFYTNQISPIISTTLFGPESVGRSVSESASTNFQSSQPSTSHLVFISGPEGCGKSTLFAQIVRLAAQEYFNKVQIIYRFCDLTLDSSSPNRLLRSVCEQFCQTQGENVTAASYIYSARKEVMNALNKILKLQSTLIFFDGLDAYKKSRESDLEWLCEFEANPRIKIFITLETDSNLYREVLGSYSDAIHISLDHPSITEWAQMLSQNSRTRRLNSKHNLFDEIKSAANSKETNLAYTDIDDILQICRIRKMNNEMVYPELTPKFIQNCQNLDNIQQVLVSHLQYTLTPYQLCALFIVLDSSRNGLPENEILTIINTIMQATKSSGGQPPKFSQALLSHLKIQLQPWLIYIKCDKIVKLSFKRKFMTRIIAHYVPSAFPNIVNEVRDLLLEYYGRQIKFKPSKGSLGNIIKSSESNLSEARDNVSYSERLWLSAQASEMIYLLILTNPSKARDYILDKHQFYLQFIHGSMPEEFVEDYDRLKDAKGRKFSHSEDLQTLVEYVKQSIYPLRYSGNQIYSQIHCRAYDFMKAGKFSKSKKLSDILNQSLCPPIKNLLPVSEATVNSFIKTRIGQSQSSNLATSISSLSAPTSQRISKSSTYSQQSANQMASKQKIYVIKDNHRHMIVIYPDRDMLSVWDIYEEKAVRTIHNIDQPRDLKMIDQKRAVILCNRELRVYDLDTGDMLTKLKGVMNQKMPFFEIFGDNYVVALARNRMYVNLLNLSTGELETTFKVGEDRFLNSLLVSENGGICVCGDETQKPFPLLVWNLNERRLLYDLRLNRHEFITRMSALSDDGHFVVSVCRQIGEGSDSQSTDTSNSPAEKLKSAPNFIVIYDLSSGTLFKKWKPGIDTCAVAITLSANRSGKVMNAMTDSSILVWDLATGSKRHKLIGHSAPVDIIKVQNNRLFSMDSTCRDQSFRIWDMDEGYCLAVFSPDAPVNCCQMSIRADALVCGFVAETRLSTLILCKNETVNDVVRRGKRRKSSKSLYIFDEPPSRKSSS